MLCVSWVSLVARLVKNPPATQEILVGFLGQEDPLEKGMATHSSIPAWRIPWTEEPGELQSMGSQSGPYGGSRVKKEKPFWLWCPQTQIRASHLLVRSWAFDPSPRGLSFLIRKMGVLFL